MKQPPQNNSCATACIGDSSTINRHCYCLTVDQAELSRQLLCQETSADLYAEILTTRPNLFSNTLVFVNSDDYQRMLATIRAIGEVVALPAYQARALQWSSAITRPDAGPSGVCMGYDFHLSDTGPQLIEINTNAGGLWLNTALARAQQRCCNSMTQQLASAFSLASIDDELMNMFVNEWQQQRDTERPQRIVIIDDNPTEQYLYPEFLLVAQLFRRHGIECDIADAKDMILSGGQLLYQNKPVDMVYNRLTDFRLEDPHHCALRTAYVENLTVITPNPKNYALYADKRNLTLLSDSDWLASLSLSDTTLATLSQHIPKTQIVTPDLHQDLWKSRREWFFKPFTGYGGKAAYRGDKLTQSTWQQITQGGYIAQQRIAPSERGVLIDAQQSTLKLDLRCYVYQDQVQLMAARLYQGQTTNFRTPGGGFASVFV